MFFIFSRIQKIHPSYFPFLDPFASSLHPKFHLMFYASSVSIFLLILSMFIFLLSVYFLSFAHFCLSFNPFHLFSCEEQLYKRLCPSGVSQKARIQQNSREFNKIQPNLAKFTTFRNCWPGDGLVFLFIAVSVYCR